MEAGANPQFGKIAIDNIRGEGGVQEVLLVGIKLQTSAVTTTWANGTLAHVDETQNSHQSACPVQAGSWCSRHWRLPSDKTGRADAFCVRSRLGPGSRCA